MRLIALLLICQVCFAGGAIHFDGDDWFECDKSFDIDSSGIYADNGGVVVYMTPDFSSSDATLRILMDNRSSGVNRGGFWVYWTGSTFRIEWNVNDLSIPIRWCPVATPSFSAGDLLGFFGWAEERQNLEQCELYNFTTATNYQGSRFDNFPYLETTENLYIGTETDSTGTPGNNTWEGKIHFLQIFKGRHLNTATNQLLRGLRKISFWPGYSGTFAIGGGSTGSRSDEVMLPVGVWFFENGEIDEAVVKLTAQFADSDNTGSTCLPQGDPTGAISEMMP